MDYIEPWNWSLTPDGASAAILILALVMVPVSGAYGLIVSNTIRTKQAVGTALGAMWIGMAGLGLAMVPTNLAPPTDPLTAEEIQRTLDEIAGDPSVGFHMRNVAKVNARRLRRARGNEREPITPTVSDTEQPGRWMSGLQRRATHLPADQYRALPRPWNVGYANELTGEYGMPEPAFVTINHGRDSWRSLLVTWMIIAAGFMLYAQTWRGMARSETCDRTAPQNG